MFYITRCVTSLCQVVAKRVSWCGAALGSDCRGLPPRSHPAVSCPIRRSSVPYATFSKNFTISAEVKAIALYILVAAIWLVPDRRIEDGIAREQPLDPTRCSAVSGREPIQEECAADGDRSA